MTEPTVSLRALRDQKLVIRPHPADAQPAPPAEATEACEQCGRGVYVGNPPAMGFIAECGRRLSNIAECRPTGCAAPYTETPCTDCEDTGITIQTERPCSCSAGAEFRAPTEATPPHDGLLSVFVEGFDAGVTAEAHAARGIWTEANPPMTAEAAWEKRAALSPSEVQPAGLGYAEGRIAGLEEAAKAVEALRRDVPYEYNAAPCAGTKRRAIAAIRALANGGWA